MEQMSPYLSLNEKLVRQIAAVERHLSQVQVASSTSPTTGPHERLGTRSIAVSYLTHPPSFSGIAMCNRPHRPTCASSSKPN